MRNLLGETCHRIALRINKIQQKVPGVNSMTTSQDAMVGGDEEFQRTELAFQMLLMFNYNTIYSKLYDLDDVDGLT